MPPAIATLLYHEVTDDPTTGFQRPSALPYKHRPVEFAANLRCIARAPEAPSLVTDVAFDGDGRYLLLTFDDGGRSARGIAEALDERGWRGHFFITTGRVGSLTFVDEADIRALHGAGHIVGSHSHTHPDIFSARPYDTMVEEWQRSCAIIAGVLGEPCVTASVPGGDLSPAVARAAAGIRYLFTSELWLHPRKVHGCWLLGRACPKVGTPLPRVEAYANYRGWARARAERAVKQGIKRLLRPLYRHYIRTRPDERPET